MNPFKTKALYIEPKMRTMMKKSTAEYTCRAFKVSTSMETQRDRIKLLFACRPYCWE